VKVNKHPVPEPARFIALKENRTDGRPVPSQVRDSGEEQARQARLSIYDFAAQPSITDEQLEKYDKIAYELDAFVLRAQELGFIQIPPKGQPPG